MKQHPIYAKVRSKRDGQIKAGGRFHWGWIDTVDTAKLVRAMLKKTWPDTKFSVRSSQYSGGSSIDVRWMDGPQVRHVRAVVGVFAGKSFDGMIDLEYSFGAWLHPDGSASPRNSEGTITTPGYDEPTDDPDALPVRFGADYVQCHRSLSPERLADVLDAYTAQYADEVSAAIRDGRAKVATSDYDGSGYFTGLTDVRVGHEWGDAVLRRFESTMPQAA